MELLDIYDKNGKYIGTEDRKVVHRDALWHKTVHCWLYDSEGNVFFQRRADSGTLYTTALGHLKAGETIEEGFSREIEEEIGIKVDASDAVKVCVMPFIMDKEKSDGSVFRDRAFSNIYVDKYEGDFKDFCFDLNEVSELVLVNAESTLEMFNNGRGSVRGKIIKNNLDIEERKILISEFLVNEGETLLGKYGEILEKVVELNKEWKNGKR